MVVDAAVVEFLESGDFAKSAIFVASCTERMAQLITGIRGGDPCRAEEVDFFLGAVGDLWNLGVPGDVFAISLEKVEEFSELQPSDEGLNDVADIYSFYGVLCLRYAVLFRLSGDSADSIKCAHASLTALGQLDQNMAGSSFFDRELEYQRQAISGDVAALGALARIRGRDQVVGLEIFRVVNSRIAR